jgi:hypothetical protein
VGLNRALLHFQAIKIETVIVDRRIYGYCHATTVELTVTDRNLYGFE